MKTTLILILLFFCAFAGQQVQAYPQNPGTALALSYNLLPVKPSSSKQLRKAKRKKPHKIKRLLGLRKTADQQPNYAKNSVLWGLSGLLIFLLLPLLSPIFLLLLIFTALTGGGGGGLAFLPFILGAFFSLMGLIHGVMYFTQAAEQRQGSAAAAILGIIFGLAGIIMMIAILSGAILFF